MNFRPTRVPRLMMDYVAKPTAIAVVFVLLALLWTFPLLHLFAYPFVFLFLAAVMCSAWFGGFISGMIAAALSSCVLAFFFMPPIFSISVAQEYRSYESAFIVCAVAVTAVSVARKRAEVAIRSSRDALDARVNERTAELERSNAEIRGRERQLRLLTEAIPQQIWRTDKDGSLEYANGDLLEYLGLRFFAIACFRARATGIENARIAPHALFVMTDRLERLRRSRWQWFSMVLLLVLVRMQRGAPMVAELTVFAQFVVFLLLPTKKAVEVVR